ncbi:hypothetical protein [Myxosarcina sp. GI1(2024)]
MLLLYLFVTLSYFVFLLSKIVEDKKSSLKDPIHIKIAILASIFWPVVIPLSLLELKAKNKAVVTLPNTKSKNISSSHARV